MAGVALGQKCWWSHGTPELAENTKMRGPTQMLGVPSNYQARCSVKLFYVTFVNLYKNISFLECSGPLDNVRTTPE